MRAACVAEALLTFNVQAPSAASPTKADRGDCGRKRPAKVAEALSRAAGASSSRVRGRKGLTSFVSAGKVSRVTVRLPGSVSDTVRSEPTGAARSRVTLTCPTVTAAPAAGYCGLKLRARGTSLLGAGTATG